MRANLNALLVIFLTTGVVLGLLLLSNHLTDVKLNGEQRDRQAKDALQLLIDSAGNNNPVINNNLKGKVVVINVWNTAFMPSIMEIPALNKLADEFHSDKVVFISLDEEDASQAGMAMVQMHMHFDYQLLFSQQPAVNAVMLLKLSNEKKTLPVNMVLDPDGHVKYYFTDYQPEKLKEIHDYLQTVVH